MLRCLVVLLYYARCQKCGGGDALIATSAAAVDQALNQGFGTNVRRIMAPLCRRNVRCCYDLCPDRASVEIAWKLWSFVGRHLGHGAS